MKNKKRLLMVGLMAFSMISIVVNSALASPTYNFSNFISGKQGFTTWDMTKSHDGATYNGRYSVFFQGNSAGSKTMKLKTELRRGSTKLGHQTVPVNYRYSKNNNGMPGNKVHLYGVRQNFWDGGTKVWGKWSADRG